jgi:hypothetical protein
MNIQYKFNTIDSILIKNAIRDVNINLKFIKNSILKTSETIEKISNFEVNIFNILGMRNLSAFIGEVFVRSIVTVSDGLFMNNPHQDGYPDLLVLDDRGKKEYESNVLHLRDKQPFSPFRTGGIEIKATCGSVPTPKILQKKGFEKPEIGDTRIDFINGYDWKAHHRLTNNLLSILWDFIDKIPTICAVFYSSDLDESDWGNIVQPKEGGGKTTSVSIMNRVGIKKMYNGWICVIDDEKYISFLNNYNNSNLIK